VCVCVCVCVMISEEILCCQRMISSILHEKQCHLLSYPDLVTNYVIAKNRTCVCLATCVMLW